MKKNVVKAMSVGLSALTIASTLNMTALAADATATEPVAEPTEEKATPTQEETAKAEAEAIVEKVEKASDDFNKPSEDEEVKGGELAKLNEAAENELEARGIDTIKEQFEDNKNLENANKAVEAADEALEKAADEDTTVALVDAAANAGEAADEVDTLVNTADTSAQAASDAADVAVTKTEEAITAVAEKSKDEANTIIAEAAQSVSEAQEKYNSAAKTLKDVEGKYADALITYNSAVEYLNQLCEDENANLDEAIQQFDAAVKALEALKKDVEKARYEYATASAGAIIYATDYEEYVKSIMKYYYLPEDASKIKVRWDYFNGTRDDSNFNVTYTVDGKEVTEKYAYAVNPYTLQVSITKCELRYEYTDKDGKPQSVTESTLNTMIESGDAVARYKFGKNYYTSEQLAAKNLDAKDADSVAYVILKSDKETLKEAGRELANETDSEGRQTVKEEITTTDLVGVAYFDKWGNYVKKYTDTVTKTTYTYVNGTLSYTTTTPAENENALKEAEDSILPEDTENSTSTITVDKSTGVWTASGYYVPVYKWTEGLIFKETHVGSLESARVFSDWELFENDAQKKQALIDEYNARPDIFDARIPHRNGSIGNGTIYYIQGYAIDGSLSKKTIQEIKDAINAQADRENKAWNTTEGALGFQWNTTEHYDVVGYDVNKSHIDYKYTAAYLLTTTTTEKGEDSVRVYKTDSQKSEEAYRKTDEKFRTTDKDFRDTVATLKERRDAYYNLSKQVKDAERELIKAKKNVEAIKNRITALKVSEAEYNAELATWNGLLQVAQQNVSDAEDNLDTAKQNLKDAQDSFADKYKVVNTPINDNPSGGEKKTYPATPAVYTQDMPVDELEIADDAVPAAGQRRAARRTAAVANNDNAVTVEDAETPLAGDTADTTDDNKDDVVAINDDATPLAGDAQKGFFQKTWWGWLLLIIAVICGTTAYAKKKATVKADEIKK